MYVCMCVCVSVTICLVLSYWVTNMITADLTCSTRFSPPDSHRYFWSPSSWCKHALNLLQSFWTRLVHIDRQQRRNVQGIWWVQNTQWLNQNICTPWHTCPSIARKDYPRWCHPCTKRSQAEDIELNRHRLHRSILSCTTTQWEGNTQQGTAYTQEQWATLLHVCLGTRKSVRFQTKGSLHGSISEPRKKAEAHHTGEQGGGIQS